MSLKTLNSRTASTPRSWPLVPPGVTLMSDAPVYSTAVEEVEIVLRAAAGDGEHVADGGVGSADAAGALRGVVHGGGVEREELIVAAAVERQIFDLALVDEAGGLLRAEVDGRRACQSLRRSD